MKKYNYVVAWALIAMSSTSWCVDTKEGEALLEKTIQKQYDHIEKVQGLIGRIKRPINWQEIFNLIDTYSINPVTFRFKKYSTDTKTVSLFEVALEIYMWHRSEGWGDRSDWVPEAWEEYENVKLKNKEALDAIKTLLEKYKIFEQKPCGGDSCDKLFVMALESDQWSIGEGRPDYKIVDLLLQYGAKPNQKSIKDIGRFLSEGEKKKYKYVGALFKR